MHRVTLCPYHAGTRISMNSTSREPLESLNGLVTKVICPAWPWKKESHSSSLNSGAQPRRIQSLFWELESLSVTCSNFMPHQHLIFLLSLLLLWYRFTFLIKKGNIRLFFKFSANCPQSHCKCSYRTFSSSLLHTYFVWLWLQWPQEFFVLHFNEHSFINLFFSFRVFKIPSWWFYKMASCRGNIFFKYSSKCGVVKLIPFVKFLL